MFPVMDESERDFLRAAVRLTYSTDDEDRYGIYSSRAFRAQKTSLLGRGHSSLAWGSR